MQSLTLLSKFGIRPRGIIHVGANYGQEFESYKSSEAETVIYIEPISKVFESLKEKVEKCPGHHAIRSVCSDRSGDKVIFNVASNLGQSSSLLELGYHAKLYPNIVYDYKEELITEALDDLLRRHWKYKDFNFLVIDAQGADLLVLQGATDLLLKIEAVYVEVAEVPLYDGGCTWGEIVEFLGNFEFHLKYLEINSKHWGNAFFVKNKVIFTAIKNKAVPFAPGRNLALGRSAKQSSLYGDLGRYGPFGGVNGKKTGTVGFHTALEEFPWWQVDLGDIYFLTEIHVYNRLDAVPERAYNFIVRLSEDDKQWKLVHRQGGIAFGGIDGNPAQIILDRVPAQFVRIELEGKGYLHLDEVEVFGENKES